MSLTTPFLELFKLRSLFMLQVKLTIDPILTSNYSYNLSSLNIYFSRRYLELSTALIKTDLFIFFTY